MYSSPVQYGQSQPLSVEQTHIRDKWWLFSKGKYCPMADLVETYSVLAGSLEEIADISTKSLIEIE